MKQARAEFVLEVVNNKLYALGGGDYYLDRTKVLSVEMYDIHQNQWTIVVNIESGMAHQLASSFIDEGNIVLLGGTTGNGWCDCITVAAKLKEKVSNHACAVLKM